MSVSVATVGGSLNLVVADSTSACNEPHKKESDDVDSP